MQERDQERKCFVDTVGCWLAFPAVRGDMLGLYSLNYVRAPRILDEHINLGVMNQSEYQ